MDILVNSYSIKNNKIGIGVILGFAGQKEGGLVKMTMEMYSKF